jgi:hypothetical protein
MKRMCSKTFLDCIPLEEFGLSKEALGLKITMNIIKKFPNGMIFSHFKTLIC